MSPNYSCFRAQQKYHCLKKAVPNQTRPGNIFYWKLSLFLASLNTIVVMSHQMRHLMSVPLLRYKLQERGNIILLPHHSLCTWSWLIHSRISINTCWIREGCMEMNAVSLDSETPRWWGFNLSWATDPYENLRKAIPRKMSPPGNWSIWVKFHLTTAFHFSRGNISALHK